MTLHLTRAAEGLERLAFTITDLERTAMWGILDPDGRVELIGGAPDAFAPTLDRLDEV